MVRAYRVNPICFIEVEQIHALSPKRVRFRLNAICSNQAEAICSALLTSTSALGLRDFLLRRAVDLVGNADLTGVDGPLAFTTQRGGTVGLGTETIAILEITERTVDRAQSRGTRGNHQA
jgi:hypothetical protein